MTNDTTAVAADDRLDTFWNSLKVHGTVNRASKDAGFSRQWGSNLVKANQDKYDAIISERTKMVERHDEAVLHRFETDTSYTLSEARDDLMDTMAHRQELKDLDDLRRQNARDARDKIMQDRVAEAMKKAAVDGKVTSEMYRAYREEHDLTLPAVTSIVAKYGSWNAAVRESGLNPAHVSYTKDEAIVFVKAARKELEKGVPLTQYRYRVLNEKHPEWATARTIIRVLGEDVFDKGRSTKKANA